MYKQTIAAVLGLLAASSTGGAGPAPSPALERFKALAGEWVAAADGPMSKQGELVARYAVTAAGSAVVETVFPGSKHEMVTVYTADLNGDGVVDGEDLGLMARAFGSVDGELLYTPGVDLDGDLSIDDSDVPYLLTEFGR